MHFINIVYLGLSDIYCATELSLTRRLLISNSTAEAISLEIAYPYEVSHLILQLTS
jgi:hypothetical protein